MHDKVQPEIRFVLASTDGKMIIDVPEELILAVQYMRETKRTGDVQLQFRDGGIAGIISSSKWK